MGAALGLSDFLLPHDVYGSQYAAGLDLDPSNRFSQKLYIAYDARQQRELIFGESLSSTFRASAPPRNSAMGLGHGSPNIAPFSNAIAIPPLPLSGIAVCVPVCWAGSGNLILCQIGTGGVNGFWFAINSTQKIDLVHFGVAVYTSDGQPWDGTNFYPRVLGFTDDGTTLTFYLDGKQFGTTRAVGSFVASGTNAPVIFQAGGGDNPNSWNSLSLLWKRALSPAEHADIAQNPWQVFKPKLSGIFPSVVASVIPTLSIPQAIVIGQTTAQPQVTLTF